MPVRKSLKPAEAELLGDLDDHGFRHAGIFRHGLQGGGLVEVPAPEDHVDHPPLQGGEVRHHHPDARPHRPRIGQRHVHSRPLRRPIDQHGDENDKARGEELVEGLDVQQRQAVAQAAEDDRAEQRADDRALAAHQRSAADGGRGDGVELPEVAERRIGGTEPADQDQAGNGGKAARDAVAGDLGHGDRHAGDMGRLLHCRRRRGSTRRAASC